MNGFFSGLRKFLIIILILSLIGLAGYLIYGFFLSKPIAPPPTPIPESKSSIALNPESQKPTLHVQKYALGGFGPDQERLDYENGSMVLYIPALDTEKEKAEFPVFTVDLAAKTAEYEEKGMVQGEIDAQLMVDMNTMLDNGVVLFTQAQLPGPENRNVSIAGHRDFKGMEFYYIDKISKGDLLYLAYGNKEYIYEYVETFVTNDSDWAPIAVSDKSKLTLQSCDPILAPNGDYDRIFVVANLIDIIDPELDTTTFGPSRATSGSGRSSESIEASLDSLSNDLDGSELSKAAE